MNLSLLVDNAIKIVKSNAPEIFTGVAIGGVAITGYLTAKASFKASKIIQAAEVESPPVEDKKEQIKKNVKLVWTCYVPPAVIGAVTVACIVGSKRASGRQTAAALTAYSISERAFSEYKEKVMEQIGKGKEQRVRDDIAQDKVKLNPPKTNEVLMLGKGDVMCCELLTRRYFRSDMETLRKAQNNINAMINNHRYVALDDFYNDIGLPATSMSNTVGWDDGMMELNFSTVLSENDEPCLAFDYSYLNPIH